MVVLLCYPSLISSTSCDNYRQVRNSAMIFLLLKPKLRTPLHSSIFLKLQPPFLALPLNQVTETAVRLAVGAATKLVSLPNTLIVSFTSSSIPPNISLTFVTFQPIKIKSQSPGYPPQCLRHIEPEVPRPPGHGRRRWRREHRSSPHELLRPRRSQPRSIFRHHES